MNGTLEAEQKDHVDQDPMTLRILARPAFKNRDKLPYNYLLYSHLRAAGARVEEYSFRRALLGRYDIFHLHWPESLLETASLWRCLYSMAGAMLVIESLRLKGTRIVWTGHDPAPHDLLFPRLERFFFAYVLRRLDGLIALTGNGYDLLCAQHASLRRLPFAVVPHGHFKNVLPDDISRAAARQALGLAEDAQVLLFFGQIRPYKGLEHLIAAFKALDDGGQIKLVIAGRPNRRSSHAALVAKLTQDVPGLQAHLEFIPVERIQVFLRAADLAVLPFARILNSGSVMLALSFGLPVLAPALGALPELQAAVGPDWLRLFEGDLTPDLLKTALRQPKPPDLPPLEAFDWPAIADQTLAAFELFRRPRP
ncbi:Glycosyltransferase involved in cell wall bisynthesis [Arboricoccus pini]|uniref:Glycosyltransferase involved in cell wall bisynthesis n=1 Tax=Arboricoccus pini TaxID=1963835 RepID=A0A212R690_9PROT|nr:glycosyltransferase family 4 protein [Arboricoccus pini]SNB67656.1 Glycosyltransferase involved in cell wall bisynthesis [Arboricoccus pini]